MFLLFGKPIGVIAEAVTTASTSSDRLLLSTNQTNHDDNGTETNATVAAAATTATPPVLNNKDVDVVVVSVEEAEEEEGDGTNATTCERKSNEDWLVEQRIQQQQQQQQDGGIEEEEVSGYKDDNVDDVDFDMLVEEHINVELFQRGRKVTMIVPKFFAFFSFIGSLLIIIELLFNNSNNKNNNSSQKKNNSSKKKRKKKKDDDDNDDGRQQQQRPIDEETSSTTTITTTPQKIHKQVFYQIKNLKSFYRLLLLVSIFDMISSFSLFFGDWAVPKNVPQFFEEGSNKDCFFTAAYEMMFPYASGSILTCTIQGLMVHIGWIGSVLFTCAISLNCYLTVIYNWKEDKLKQRLDRYYIPSVLIFLLGSSIYLLILRQFNPGQFGFCWIAPSPLASMLLNDDERQDIGLYVDYPENTRGVDHWNINIFVFGTGIILLVLVVIMYSMISITCYVRKQKRLANTAALDNWEKIVRYKGMRYVGAYILIYLPAMVGSSMDLEWPYIDAVIYSLLCSQGILNVLVYAPKNKGSLFRLLVCRWCRNNNNNNKLPPGREKSSSKIQIVSKSSHIHNSKSSSAIGKNPIIIMGKDGSPKKNDNAGGSNTALVVGEETERKVFIQQQQEQEPGVMVREQMNNVVRPVMAPISSSTSSSSRRRATSSVVEDGGGDDESVIMSSSTSCTNDDDDLDLEAARTTNYSLPGRSNFNNENEDGGISSDQAQEGETTNGTTATTASSSFRSSEDEEIYETVSSMSHQLPTEPTVPVASSVEEHIREMFSSSAATEEVPTDFNQHTSAQATTVPVQENSEILVASSIQQILQNAIDIVRESTSEIENVVGATGGDSVSSAPSANSERERVLTAVSDTVTRTRQWLDRIEDDTIRQRGAAASDNHNEGSQPPPPRPTINSNLFNFPSTTTVGVGGGCQAPPSLPPPHWPQVPPPPTSYAPPSSLSPPLDDSSRSIIRIVEEALDILGSDLESIATGGGTDTTSLLSGSTNLEASLEGALDAVNNYLSSPSSGERRTIRRQQQQQQQQQQIDLSPPSSPPVTTTAWVPSVVDSSFRRVVVSSLQPDTIVEEGEGENQDQQEQTFSSDEEDDESKIDNAQSTRRPNP